MKLKIPVGSLALLGIASHVAAQTGGQRVTVTGSSIERIATAGALPLQLQLQLITRGDLEREGVTSAEQAIVMLVPSTAMAWTTWPAMPTCWAAVLQQPIDRLTCVFSGSFKLGEHLLSAEFTGSQADAAKRFGGKFTLEQADASVSGPIVSLPAGDPTGAPGVDLSKEKYKFKVQSSTATSARPRRGRRPLPRPSTTSMRWPVSNATRMRSSAS